jgi:hypothetical protein
VAEPVKFKQRVRAKPDAPLPAAGPGRAWVLWVGAALWLVTVAVCLRVTEAGSWLYGWFADDVRGSQLAAAGPSAQWAPQHAGEVSLHAPGRARPARWLAPLAEPSHAKRGHQPFRPLAPWAHQVGAAGAASADPMRAAGPPLGSAAPGRSSAAGRGRDERATSCEGAIAAHRQRVTSGKNLGPAKLTFGRNRSIIENGSYLVPCRLPENLELRVCAAIQHGRAVGVTVHTSPLDRRVRDCVAQAVRELEFPPDSQLDVTRAYFSPL